MMDKNTRSIVKSITWRLSATLATIILVYVVTRDIKASLGIGLIEVFLKLFLYYLHERVWNKIKWGRKVLVESEKVES
ncbi:hypothetical protein C0584_01820 [Candidatus Parcubacteria bacterium]|nr:MAG: hypothetical protein C0584_01820 [Candidatus Parcubacteria bacterium]